ncbi:SurA N-terminal domain-containing protein [Aurantivibrio plasticivorans]
MLQSLRDNLKGAVAVIIVGLMVVPLVLFGVDSLFTGSISPGEVAEVEGEKITEIDLQRAISARQNQLRSQFGDNLPEEFLSDDNLREPVLNELIRRKVMVVAAKDSGFAASPARINEYILSVPDFRVDGKFDENTFRNLLARVGYTPMSYRSQLEEDIVLGQQVAGLTSSSFITDAQLERMVALSQQSRSFHYLTVPLAPVQASIEISDEEIGEYYEANKADYQNPEQVAIEFVELNLAQLEEQIELSEEDIREQYEQEISAFVADSERRAAHILIEAKDDGSEQEIIADVQKRLADGEAFADVAEELSDDFGSREDGGDLGFTSGDTFPQAFEDALASLQVGEVSAPVVTDAGTHIIKLLEVSGAEPPSFEEDRGRIERAMRRAMAEDRFVELRRQYEDLTYNVAELGPAAKELGLRLQFAGPFSRSGGFGLASNPKVIEAAFDGDALDTRHSSDVIEVSSTHLVVLRVTNHHEPRALELDEVKNSIVADLKRNKAIAEIASVADELVSEIQSGKSVEEVAQADEYEWQIAESAQRNDPKVGRDILQHVFAMAKPAGSALVEKVELASGDYAVVSLTSVTDGSLGNLSDAEKANLSDRLASSWGEVSYSAFEAHQQAQASIDR